MFKFLFGGKKAPETAVPETDRERFTRLTTDLNELIDTLPVKPRVTLDPATGRIELEQPEQFADEALALPAPDAEAKPETTDEMREAEPAEVATGKITEGDAVAAKPKIPVPNPPVPNPPKPMTHEVR